MSAFSPAARRNALAGLIVFHILIIIASNYLVQLPMTLFGWQTTWGAFSFPFIFLATDLTVRLLGKGPARRVIARVMLPALLASYVVSVLFQDGGYRGFAALGEFNTFVGRIALGSFLAYALGQILDIQVFDRLRKLPQWWIAPVVSTLFGNLMDTFAFFSVAFWRSANPFMAEHWVEIATVDYGVKLAVSLILFVPLYGLLLNAILRRLAPRPQAA
ncbi:7-cyano-7-deazaguanine/7-aminomethyl-7-deazaguanine transporter [Pseudomonas citronellolis]|uniref:7-cyano-7-deazaguanine/7-aminomethyl-7- deazaguanine transporter n=1 Tax=Pseudomonas citronellolis TaxID=53408 RepID=UPI0023E3EDF4|nr:7-cyano-7-deazaguanine/7-aminomethyl-7-deazaguanine transporter [Pseudomonas citronellolis]MDF3934429.1 7-cyano-7-deazaguanine/7-aminomethyl-7-deazaguanine transporter [Pseudomonas citronellolis]